MVYVTTRNKYDTYTVFRAIQSDRGTDGGMYLPFRLPKLDKEDLLALKDMSFCERLTKVLNMFFSARLTVWDVELCTGKNPAKLVSMSHRILVAEAWHNLEQDFAQMERRLSARICGCEDADKKPASWVSIAIRIAILFAIYGDLLATEATRPDTLFDIATASGDFSTPMAAWYARAMGLPVGNIICSHEDASVWNLIHQGEVRTDGGMPENLERLICATLGVDENLRYCEICNNGRLYVTQPGQLEVLRKGMYGAVISNDRVTALIPSVYRMAGYIMGTQTALAYSGLQDYRAKSGENRLVLLLSEESPLKDAKIVTAGLEISEKELREKVGE